MNIPAAKVFSLVIKTLAKPLAKELKHQASNSGTLKGGVIWLGQSFHKASTIVSVRAAGFGTAKVKPLEESKALSLGGDILSEFLVFSVAGGLLIWEYRSSNAKAAVKADEQKAKKAQEDQELRDHLANIYTRLDDLETKINTNRGLFSSLLGGTAAKNGDIPKKSHPPLPHSSTEPATSSSDSAPGSIDKVNSEAVPKAPRSTWFSWGAGGGSPQQISSSTPPPEEVPIKVMKEGDLPVNKVEVEVVLGKDEVRIETDSNNSSTVHRHVSKSFIEKSGVVGPLAMPLVMKRPTQ